MKKQFLLLKTLFLTILFTSGLLSNPLMVKDINPNSDSQPSSFVVMDGKLYFSANDGTNGYELWVSDGTADGTIMIKDINSNGDSEPSSFVEMNGKLYFSATDGTNGYELWVSDGTAEGTKMLKDILSDAGSSYPTYLTVMNNKLYFCADNGTNGYELWVSDGTAEGTKILKDIRSSGSSNPTHLTVMNNKLYFSANDGTNGYELWVSNGTADETMMLKDIWSNASSSYPVYLTVMNNKLYFSASDGTNGKELWVSDGTESGTKMLKDINPRGDSSSSNFIEMNGKLYFSATDGTKGFELWVSDGTADGTMMLKDIRSGDSSYPKYLTVMNNKLYFSANDGTKGKELWVSDGTADGTEMLKDIRSGISSSAPANLTAMNNKLYFSATDGTNGYELWIYKLPLFEISPLSTIQAKEKYEQKLNLLSSNANILSWSIGQNSLPSWLSLEGNISKATDFDTNTSIKDPASMMLDNDGNLFVAGRSDDSISKYDSNGNKTSIVSGLGGVIRGVAVDRYGNIYALDQAGNKIIQMKSDGTSQSDFATGFNSPYQMAIDRSNNIFVADRANHKIVKVSPDGTKTDFATGLSYPKGIAIDNNDNIYIVEDSGNREVKKITPSGTVTTIGEFGSEKSIYSIGVDDEGNVYIPSFSDSKIYMMSSTGVLQQIATDTTFSGPYGATYDSKKHRVFISTNGDDVIKVIDLPKLSGTAPSSASSNAISLVGSDGVESLDLNYTLEVYNNTPSLNISASTSINKNNLYEYNISISDADNDIVSLDDNNSYPSWLDLNYTSTSTLLTSTNLSFPSTTVGAMAQNKKTGNIYFTHTTQIIKYTPKTNDFEVFASDFNTTRSIDIDSDGNLFVLDSGVKRIYKVSSDGTKEEFATNLDSPYDIAIDSKDNIYVTEQSLNIIRMYTPNGTKSDFASRSYFDSIRGIAIDRDDNIYVANNTGGIVYKFSYNGSGSTFASLDTNVKIYNLDIDSKGNLYVPDYDNDTIYKIDKDKNVSTFVTTSDGLIDAAYGVLYDEINDDMYISQWSSDKITKIDYHWQLSGTPTVENVGEHNVSITLSDGIISTDYNFTITVSDPKPTITSDAVTSVYVDGNYSYTLSASDVDGDSLTWSVKSGTNLPSWLELTTIYFTEQTGTANQFDGVDVGSNSTPTFVDIDNDGDMDAFIGEYNGVIKYYKNEGNNSTPKFVEKTQGDNPFGTVDVGVSSAPTFVDIDNDGDMDAFIGEYNGVIKYYKNEGNNSSPNFVEKTQGDNPFGTVDVGNLSTPTFVDIDNDGDMDVFIGDYDGVINFYKNTGTNSSPTFTAQTESNNPFDGVDVGFSSAPTFVDIDNDGDMDVFIGESIGVINFYKNIGTNSSPTFTAQIGENNPFDGVDVGTYSAPTFVDIDNDGDMDAFIGENYGMINFYKNNAGVFLVGTPTSANVGLNDVNLTLSDGVNVVDYNFQIEVKYVNHTPTDINITKSNIDENNNIGDTIGTLGTIDGDSVWDSYTYSFCSNEANFTLDGDKLKANIKFDYENKSSYQVCIKTTDSQNATFDKNITIEINNLNDNTPTITSDAITSVYVDGNYSYTLLASDVDGDKLTWSVKSDTNLPSWLKLSTVYAELTVQTGTANPFYGIDVGSNSTPTFLDIDNDGDMDAFIGEKDGVINFYKNEGNNSSPNFIAQTGDANPFGTVDVGSYFAPTFVDIDNDGDMDAFIGDYDGVINFYKNTGTNSSPTFTAQTETANPFNKIDVGVSSTPTFVDIDNDGDMDAFIGGYGGMIYFYKNTGTNSSPTFTAQTETANPINGIDVGNYSAPTFVDIDNDGDMDAFIGEYQGVIYFYKNTGSKSSPTFTEQTGSNNPFDGVDVGSYSAPIFVDIDKDGDMDAFIGEQVGVINFYKNNAGVFLVGTPTSANAGLNDVNLTLSDGVNEVPYNFQIEVQTINHAPTASNISFSINEDTNLTFDNTNINILAEVYNDADDNTFDSIYIISLPQKGNLKLNEDNVSVNQKITLTQLQNLIYIPELNGNGESYSSFNFKVNDGELNSTSEYTATINVTAVDDAPTLASIDDQSKDENFAPYTISLKGDDVDGNIIEYFAESNNTEIAEVTTITSTTSPNVEIKITPITNANGIVKITVKAIANAKIAIQTFTLTINSVDNAPILNDIQNPSAKDEDFSEFNITLSSTDVENDSVIYAAKSNEIVNVQILNNNILQITSKANVYGQASIDVNVTQENNSLLFDSQTISFTINSINDAPTASDINFTIDEDTTLNFDTVNIAKIASTYNDIENDAFTKLKITSLPQKGNLYSGTSKIEENQEITLDQLLNLKYTPESNKNGTPYATFAFKVSDSKSYSLDSYTVSINVRAINDQPTFTTELNDVNLSEDMGVKTYSIIANDFEGDELNISVESNNTNILNVTPSWDGNLVQGEYTGKKLDFNISTIENANGSVQITIMVDDGDLNITKKYIVNVEPQNDTPTIISVADINKSEDFGSFDINISVDDIDRDDLNITASTTSNIITLTQNWTNPLTSSTYENNQTLRINSVANKFGSAQVDLKVTDTNGTSSDTSFAINIPAVLDFPSISDENISLNEDFGTYNIELKNIDTGMNGNVTIVTILNNDSLVGVLSPLNNISVSDVNLTFSSLSNKYGTVDANISVTDGSQTVSKVITLTIDAVNDAPTISGVPTIKINEDETYSFTPTATDIEVDTLIFSITNKPSWAEFNTTTGTLSGKPHNNDVGYYKDIKISVSDNDKTSQLNSFNIQVIDVNSPPVLESIENQQKLEDSISFELDLNATDEENDPITYTVDSNNTNIATVTIVDGKLVVTLIENAHGTVTIEVNATANGQTATQTFDINITNIDDAPYFTKSILNQSVAEDFSDFNITLEADDLESDILVYSANSSDESIATVNVVGDKLIISSQQNKYGIVRIDLNVSQDNNGSLYDTISFDLVINARNDAPTLDMNTTTIEILEDNGTIVYDFNISDIDGDTLSISVESNNTNLVTVSSNFDEYINQASWSSESFDFNISTVQNANGKARITLTLVDENDGNTTKTFDINVISVNDLPIISLSESNITTNEDVNKSIPYIISDVEDNSLTLLIETNASNGLVTIDSDRIIYTPNSNYHGIDSFTISTIDSSNGKVTQDINVTIVSVDDAPVLSNISNLTNQSEDVDLNITLNATDADGDTITYIADSNNTSIATVSIVNGKLVVTPVENAHGTVTIEVNATANGQTVSQSFELEITNVNDTPTLASIQDIAESEDFTTFNVTITPADIDGDNLRLTVDMNTSTIIQIPTNSTDWISNANYSSGLTLPITAIANKSGVVELNVTVEDPSGAKTSELFTITVNPSDDAPVANSMAATVGPNSVNTFNTFTPNFSDIDGDNPIMLRIETLPTVGTFEDFNRSGDENWTTITTAPFEVAMNNLANYRFNAGNNSELTTDVNWSIMTSYDNTYENGLWSNVATGVVTIIDPSSNHAPDVNISTSSDSNISGDIITINEDGKTNPIFITFSDDYTPSKFLVGVIDSNDSSKVSLADEDFNITRIADNNVSVIITPKANVYGDVNITLGAFDGDKNGTRSFTLHINSINDIPTALNFEKTINEDTNYSFSSLDPTTVYSDTNDSTQDESETYPDIFQIVTLPQHGILHLGDSQALIADTNVSLENLGNLVYTPEENNNTDVNFTWRAFDGESWTEIKTATIIINAVDDAPVFTSSFTDFNISEDGTMNDINLSSFDVENNSITYSATSSNDDIAIVSIVNGKLVVTPKANKSGTVTITVNVIANGKITTQTFTLSIDSVNDTPTIDTTFSTITLLEDAATTNYDLNVSDIDGDDLNVTITSSNENLVRVTPNWTHLLNSNGLVNQANYTNLDFNITTVPNANGIATITLTLRDINGATDTTTFDINVTAINDAPTLASLSNVIVYKNSGDKNITVVANDVDGDNLTYGATATTNGNLFDSLTFSGNVLQVALKDNVTGNSDINVTVTDGTLTASKSFNFYILPLEDGTDTAKVNDINVTTENNTTTTSLNISETLTVKTQEDTNGTVTHEIVVNGKEIKATSQIVGSVAEFTDNGVHTTYSDSTLNLEVNASLDGKATHVLTTNGKTTTATSEFVGATTLIKRDSISNKVEIETSVAIDLNTTIKVTAREDGTAEHSVIKGTKETKATSTIAGATTKITSSGSVETSAGETSVGGYTLKAKVITDENGKTQTRFVKVNNTNPNDEENLGNTVIPTTPFEAGNNVQIEEISGTLYMKIEAPLSNTNLIIE